MAPQGFQLIMKTGPQPGQVFLLSGQEIIIGRDANTGITIDIAEVSRKHARLSMQSGGYVIEDAGSTNGTFVNGKRLMGSHRLRPGETINLGDAVSLSYEANRVDPDATVMAASPVTGVMPARKESPKPPPPPPPAPSHVGSAPASTDLYASPEPKKQSKAWLLAGIGCFVVVACILLIGGFAFDYFDFYCTPPFDILFSCP